MLLIVRLDDPKFGAGPATVIAITDDATSIYRAPFVGRDGAHDPALRVWEGDAFVGERVILSAEPSLEEIKAWFIERERVRS